VLRREPYTCSSDIFSFGHLLYELCNRKPLYNASTMESLLEKHSQPYDDIDSTTYSPALCQLVKSMLHRDWRKRPTIRDIMKSTYVASILATKMDLKLSLLRDLLDEPLDGISTAELEPCPFTTGTSSPLEKTVYVNPEADLMNLPDDNDLDLMISAPNSSLKEN